MPCSADSSVLAATWSDARPTGYSVALAILLASLMVASPGCDEAASENARGGDRSGSATLGATTGRAELRDLAAQGASAPAVDVAAPTPPARPSTVVVIGVDGATLRVMGPLMERGLLTTFANLAAGGRHGILRSETPTASPALWNTIATGVPREVHGIEGFIRRVPGEPESMMTPVTDRKVPALWNLASARGLKVGVIGWWATWPAERVNGFVVANNFTVVGTRRGATYPRDLVERLDGLVSGGTDPNVVMRTLVRGEAAPPCLRGVPPPRYEGLRPDDRSPQAIRDSELCSLVQRDLVAVELGVGLFREQHPNLLMVYLRGLDAVQHRFWKYSFPDEAHYRLAPTATERTRYGGVIPAYYRFVDQMIASLLEATGEATILVVSDHGARADATCGGRVFHHNVLLSDLGLLRAGETGIDYRRTAILHDAVRFQERASLFVNLQSRSHDHGIVSDAEYSRVVNRAQRAFETVLLEDGTPLFEEIGVDLSPPGERETPDMWLGLAAAVREDANPVSRRVRVAGRLRPLLRYMHERDASGVHDTGEPSELEGIVFVHGAGIPPRLEAIEASIYDVAPSVACLLGFRLVHTSDHGALPALLPDGLAAGCATQPFAMVPAPVSLVDVEGEPGSQQEGDESLRRQLRALGYIQ